MRISNAYLPNGTIQDIIIEGPTIAAIENPIKKLEKGKYPLLALPGLIDPHVHFRTPGHEYKEDWLTGSLAAVAGGVTTVFDMPNTDPPLTTFERIEEKVRLVGDPPVNYRFWFGATPDNLGEIEKAADHPIIVGVKIYMARSTGNLLVSKDDDLLRIFQLGAKIQQKKPHFLVAVHAEDEDLIVQKRKALKQDPTITDHCCIRDTEVEVRAVQRALRLQEIAKCRLYFCHTSTPEAVELIYAAKRGGAKVYVEVCPHHMFVSEEMLIGEGGAFFKMNPPLRSALQVMRLRDFVCQPGYVDTIATDHAPHTSAEKHALSYDEIPSGVTGVQTLLPLSFSLVREGRMSLNHFLNLTSRNAAQIFGLGGQKGYIQKGADADLIVVDPDAKEMIRNERMISKCGWTPYHGKIVHGKIRETFARGNYVYQAL